MERGQFMYFLHNLNKVSTPNMGTNDNNTNEEYEPTSNVVFPIPAAQRVKRSTWDFYEKTLGAPKYVVSEES